MENKRLFKGAHGANKGNVLMKKGRENIPPM